MCGAFRSADAWPEGRPHAGSDAESTTRSSRGRCRRPVPAPAARRRDRQRADDQRANGRRRHYTDSSGVFACRAPTVASGVNPPDERLSESAAGYSLGYALLIAMHRLFVLDAAELEFELDRYARQSENSVLVVFAKPLK